MADKRFPVDLFQHMETLFKMWLAGARHREILRLLELVQEELRRRGHVLTYEIHKENR